MNKADLRTGMVVELRNGQRYLVLCGELPTRYYKVQSTIFISEGDFRLLSNYSDDLRSTKDDSNDVIKVYSPDIAGFQATFKNISEPIWTRQPEVDWSKVAVDTKVFVRDNDDHHQWKPKHFARYQGGKVFTWLGGNTSFTENLDMAWKYAKLAEEVKQ